MAGKKVAIIGAGWYGGHTALEISKFFKEMFKWTNVEVTVTVYEKNSKILDATSGNFGVRLHLGPHYPRSKETRESCIRGYDKFLEIYPELVTKHGQSLYAVGDRDIDGNVSKVNAEEFNALVDEHNSFKIKELNQFKEYEHVETILDTGEMNIMIGSKLRDAFMGYFEKEKVEIKLNTEIERIVTNADGKVFITTKGGVTEEFDAVINATSYQQFLPNRPLLFGMELVYQSCVGLLYEDMQEEEKGPANGLIIMDGWFPCMVHYDKEGENGRSRFLLTHAKLTNLNSCKTAEEARTLLFQELATPGFLSEVEEPARKHMDRFYPGFSDRFKFIKCQSTVHAKISSNTDFRETVVFNDKESNIIHIVPGKIANVTDAAEDILKLLAPILTPALCPEASNSQILSENGYEYVDGGTLSRSKQEVSQKPTDPARSTYVLQTGAEILTNIKRFPSPRFFTKVQTPQRAAEAEKLASLQLVGQNVISIDSPYPDFFGKEPTLKCADEAEKLASVYNSCDGTKIHANMT